MNKLAERYSECVGGDPPEWCDNVIWRKVETDEEKEAFLAGFNKEAQQEDAGPFLADSGGDTVPTLEDTMMSMDEINTELGSDTSSSSINFDSMDATVGGSDSGSGSSGGGSGGEDFLEGVEDDVIGDTVPYLGVKTENAGDVWDDFKTIDSTETGGWMPGEMEFDPKADEMQMEYGADIMGGKSNFLGGKFDLDAEQSFEDGELEADMNLNMNLGDTLGDVSIKGKPLKDQFNAKLKKEDVLGFGGKFNLGVEGGGGKENTKATVGYSLPFGAGGSTDPNKGTYPDLPFGKSWDYVADKARSLADE